MSTAAWALVAIAAVGLVAALATLGVVTVRDALRNRDAASVVLGALILVVIASTIGALGLAVASAGVA